MQPPKATSWSIDAFTLELHSRNRESAHDAAKRAVGNLRRLFDFSPALEEEIIWDLVTAFFSGLMQGVAESDPKKAKQVQGAIRLLEQQRQNAAKGVAARRARGAQTRDRVRQLNEKYRKTVSKKGVRVEKISAELGISTRTVERHLNARR